MEKLRTFINLSEDYRGHPRIRAQRRVKARSAAELQDRKDRSDRSISDSIVAAALDDAKQTIEDAQIIRLSIDDQQRFAELLMNPPPLAPAMRFALEARKRLIADAK